MTTITITKTTIVNDQTYKKGETYQLRSREAKEVLKTGNAVPAEDKAH